MTSDQVASLAPALPAFLQPFRVGFAKAPAFRHLSSYLLGLLSDLSRKSVEPIALATGTAVRTLQEFLADYPWDEQRVQEALLRQVADRHPDAPGPGGMAIAVLDESAHAKRGPKTPGAQRQYCGESGKIDNCVVGVHLIYTTPGSSPHDTVQDNSFTCALASDLYLPQSWVEDAAQRQEARIPAHLAFRTKWQIGLDLIRQAIGQGLRLDFVTFDENYGQVPAFWRGLDALGQKAIGEVPRHFRCWVQPPRYRSLQKPFAAHRVDRLLAHSPVFYGQAWRALHIKDTTRGPMTWQIKAARVQIPDTDAGRPSDRRYWLIVARRPHAAGGFETKYFLCNGGEGEDLLTMLRAGFARWQVEKWFERGKQEAGLGDFEVRTYRSLIRHWLIARLAMLFLAEQTARLRGEKSADHLRAGGRVLPPAAGETAGPLVAVMG